MSSNRHYWYQYLWVSGKNKIQIAHRKFFVRRILAWRAEILECAWIFQAVRNLI
jgi:hypothetical protein